MGAAVINPFNIDTGKKDYNTYANQNIKDYSPIVIEEREATQ